MNANPHYQIRISTTDGYCALDESFLRGAIVATLRRHRVRRARLSVALVGDRRITELHQTFLGVGGPTDVLAFDLRDRMDDRDAVDGEIVISVETANREAASRGHGVSAEMCLYAIHGVLHLLGFDDGDAESSREIHSEEDAILQSIGLGTVYKPHSA